MKIYKTVKRIYNQDLTAYIPEGVVIQVYEEKFEIHIEEAFCIRVFRDIILKGEKETSWFHNILEKEVFLELLFEIDESIKTREFRYSDISIDERNLLMLTSEDANKVSIFNTTFSRKEVWNGRHWVGIGDIVCASNGIHKIGEGYYINGFREVDGVSIPRISNAGNANTRRLNMTGVVSHISDDGESVVLTTQGICYALMHRNTRVGNRLKLITRGKKFNNAGTRNHKVGVSLSNTSMNELALIKLTNFSEDIF